MPARYARCALGLYVALVASLAGVASALPPTAMRSRCAPRRDVRLQDELGGATFAVVGRELVAVPATGRRLYRSSGCDARFRPVAVPFDLDGARSHVAGDALVVLGVAGTGVYRRGRVHALDAPLPPGAVAAHEHEVLFVAHGAPGRAGILDARRRTVLDLPGSIDLAPPLPGRAPALALDARRAFIFGGASDLVYERALGTWTQTPAAPALDYPTVIPTPSGAVLVGTVRTDFALRAHAWDAASNTWRELPLPSSTTGRLEGAWREGDRVIVQIVHGSDHSAIVLDPSTLAWQPVEGSVRGGRPVTGGAFVLVGVQSPAPRPGDYPAAAVDPTARRWRYASIPEVPQDRTALFHAGGLVVVQPPRSVPLGWTSTGCEGPREPGAPACDPVSVPLGARHEPGSLSIVPLAWR